MIGEDVPGSVLPEPHRESDRPVYDARMEHRRIGTSGPSVSVLGLGTMTFGAESDEETSHAMLDRFAEAGGTLIDTADVYSAGVSEEIVGRWLRQRRDRERFVVATKGRFAPGHDHDHAGASRVNLTNALDASLRRLQTDVIDLYQVHCWDPLTPLEETLETLSEMVRAGKVRPIGVSNYAGYQFARAAATARLEGLAPIVSLQAQYSLLLLYMGFRVSLPIVDEGVGLLPWSPLGGGWLTGKYSRDQLPTGASRLGEDPTRGVEAYDLRNTDQTWRVLEVCNAVATAHGVSPAAVALAWLRDRPAVSSVILGTRTVEQLDQNLLASELTLTGGV